MVAAIERLNKSTQTFNGRNDVSTLALSLLIGFPSFVQERRTTIKTLMSSNYGQITPRTAELPALEHLKHRCILL